MVERITDACDGHSCSPQLAHHMKLANVYVHEVFPCNGLTYHNSISSLSTVVLPDMALLPSAGSDRAFVWTVQADFADEEAKTEQLAIRFKNSESELVYSELPCLCKRDKNLTREVLQR